MKFKLIAFVLILAIASWAQTATPAPSSPDNASPEAKCSCCDKATTGTTAASHKHMDACMQKSGSKDGKEVASCCSGKDKATCCTGKDGNSCAKMTASSGCCGNHCSAEGAKDCCSDGKDCARKDAKKTAHNCCGSQCMHAQPQPTPGN